MSKRRPEETIILGIVLSKEDAEGENQFSERENAENAAELVRIQGQYLDIANAECNRSLSEREEKKAATLKQRAGEIASLYGAELEKYRSPLSGFVLILPSGRSNQHGKGYYVPGK